MGKTCQVLRMKAINYDQSIINNNLTGSIAYSLPWLWAKPVRFYTNESYKPWSMNYYTANNVKYVQWSYSTLSGLVCSINPQPRISSEAINILALWATAQFYPAPSIAMINEPSITKSYEPWTISYDQWSINHAPSTTPLSGDNWLAYIIRNDAGGIYLYRGILSACISW